jgi:hypothetical protein
MVLVSAIILFIMKNPIADIIYNILTVILSIIANIWSFFIYYDAIKDDANK